MKESGIGNHRQIRAALAPMKNRSATEISHDQPARRRVLAARVNASVAQSYRRQRISRAVAGGTLVLAVGAIALTTTRNAAIGPPQIPAFVLMSGILNRTPPSATAGDTLTAIEDVRLRTRRGTEIRVDKHSVFSTEISRDDRVETIRLQTGGVTFHVPKVPPKGRFEVITPASRVQVVGTVFRVVHTSGAKRSCVSVDEGTVRVHPENGGAAFLVQAGQSDGCVGAALGLQGPPLPPSTATAAGEPEVQKTDANRAHRKAKATPEKPQHSVVTSARDLALQNDIFRRALAAEKSGNTQQAARLFGQLLREHPGSPLADEATIHQRYLQSDAAPPAHLP